jgi:hypothetical protein
VDAQRWLQGTPKRAGLRPNSKELGQDGDQEVASETVRRGVILESEPRGGHGDGARRYGERHDHDTILERVRKAPEANHIRGECVGNTLTLYVNGQVVLEAKDAEYGSGRVGLFVRDFGFAPGTNGSFDNIVVSEY